MTTSSNPPRFAFLGTPEFAATILAGLLANKWVPEIVITEAAKPVGRRKILTPSAVEQLARSHNLSVATPATKADITSLLQPLDLDLAIVAAYGKIIPQAAIETPARGIINVHASLLPKYRGAAPIQAAILNGDKETGISFMLIEPSLDTGPVIATFKTSIEDTDTALTLTNKLAELAAKNICQVTLAYLQNKAKPIAQPEGASYSPKITKADGEIKILSEDPVDLDRKFRAYFPWPGIYSQEFGRRLIVKKAKIRNGIFDISELQWEGKPPVNAADFARANPKLLTQLPKQIRIDAT